MTRHLVILLVVLLAVCGCSPNKHVDSQLSRENQIREAVFRYQFSSTHPVWAKRRMHTSSVWDITRIPVLNSSSSSRLIILS